MCGEIERDPLGERAEFPIQESLPPPQPPAGKETPSLITEILVGKGKTREWMWYLFLSLTPFTAQSCSPQGRKDQERLEAVA